MKERHPMDTLTINGNNFVRVEGHQQAGVRGYSSYGNHFREASAEEVLPGYDAFMAGTQ